MYIYIYIYIYICILQSVSVESEQPELSTFFHSACTSIFCYHMYNLKVRSLDNLLKLDVF